jgi:hypothetical protein
MKKPRRLGRGFGAGSKPKLSCEREFREEPRMRNPQSIDAEAVAQARAAWAMAVDLLTGSGMSDPAARKAFGGLLSKHRGLKAADLLPALEAAHAAGTCDAYPFLVKAAQRAAERAGDPALKVGWT